MGQRLAEQADERRRAERPKSDGTLASMLHDGVILMPQWRRCPVPAGVPEAVLVALAAEAARSRLPLAAGRRQAVASAW